jgi:hypothetical protein
MNIRRSVAVLLVLVFPLLLFACGDNGGGVVSSSSSSGIFTINTMGGLGGSDGGSGGNGDSIDIEMSYGTGGDIVVSASGSADASFAPSEFTPYYGTNPLTISADVAIEYTPAAEPAVDTLYIDTDDNLYISDGDTILGSADADELAVTGVKINEGITVTFGVAGDANVTLNLENDFVNYGTVTTADQDATNRGDLGLYVGSFLNMGTIALNGTLDGQNGGDFDVDADEALFINKGTINTYGADNEDADAGDGGYLYIYGEHFTENTGPIATYGGVASGTGGIGGDGGYVYFEADYYGDARNSAEINAYGGDGVTGGGNGGYFYLYIEYTGDCVNSGTLNLWGGDTESGTAGSGGYTYYETWQGGIRHNADINAWGGSATEATGDGGNGGYFYIGSWCGSSYEPTPGEYTPIKDTEISGDIDLHGGHALATGTGSGGDGGYFYLEMEGDDFPLAQRAKLLGYKLFDTRGGDGNDPGDGGYIYFWQGYSYDYDNYYSQGGFDVQHVNFDTRGGNVVADATTTPAYGGDGGYVELDMDTYSYVNVGIVPFDLPDCSFVGDINTSGGESLESDLTGSGVGGYVWIYAKAGIDFTGNITATGGDDQGTTTGYGGAGDYVSLMADYGDIVMNGDIDMSGGYGAEHGGDAGTTGDPTLATSQGVVSAGNITADGGDADPDLAGSIGGNAGDFWLFAPQGPASVSYAILSAKGGAGETEGADGEIIAGGYTIAP